MTNARRSIAHASVLQAPVVSSPATIASGRRPFVVPQVAVRPITLPGPRRVGGSDKSSHIDRRIALRGPPTHQRFRLVPLQRWSSENLSQQLFQRRSSSERSHARRRAGVAMSWSGTRNEGYGRAKETLVIVKAQGRPRRDQARMPRWRGAKRPAHADRPEDSNAARARRLD